MSLTVFITGGSGLLGAELARRALARGHEVIAGYKTHLPPCGSRIQFDLAKPDEVEQAIKRAHPEIIIHSAAISDVDMCEAKPAFANLVNGEATGRIGEAASNLNAHVIYVSTDYVFDGRGGLYGEEDRPNPINRYGSSKLLGEELLTKSGANHSIARTSVVYGWGRDYRPNFATWVLRQLESKQSLEVVNDQFASPTLNSNLADMILELAGKSVEGVIHLAGYTKVDRYSFARRIAETFHYDPNLIKPVKSEETSWKAKRPLDSSLNVERARKLFAVGPLKLDEALQRFRASRGQGQS